MSFDVGIYLDFSSLLPYFHLEFALTISALIGDALRVIAGKYKRRNLSSAPGTSITRPTSDRVKESLFNILSDEVLDACVLDLFSGSGALGIEALSRGARHVIFVESDSIALRFLQENLSNLKIPTDCFTVIHSTVEHMLRGISRASLGFFDKEECAASINLVFADPPYNSSWYNEALENLENSDVCTPDCLLVLEMEHTRELNGMHESWAIEDTRSYGKTKLQFWRRQPSN